MSAIMDNKSTKRFLESRCVINREKLNAQLELLHNLTADLLEIQHFLDRGNPDPEKKIELEAERLKARIRRANSYTANVNHWLKYLEKRVSMLRCEDIDLRLKMYSTI